MNPEEAVERVRAAYAKYRPDQSDAERDALIERARPMIERNPQGFIDLFERDIEREAADSQSQGET